MVTCWSCTAEDCWKDEHPTSKTDKTARCRLSGTLVNSPQVDNECIASSLQKTKHPADFSHDSGGVLTDVPSEEGVQLSRTGNSKFNNVDWRNKKPASLRADWPGYAKKKCQAPPLEDLPSCGDAGGVNNPVQWQLKFSNPSHRNKRPAPAEASAS